MSKRFGFLALLLFAGSAFADLTGNVAPPGGGGGGGGFTVTGSVTSGHCLELLTTTTGQDSGGGCGGSPDFSTIGAGTNANALVIGSGGSLSTSGTGFINASSGTFQLQGTSTGHTSFASANASATNYTATFPAATDTVVELGATQTLTNKTLTAPVLGAATATSLNGNTFTTGTYTLTGTAGKTLDFTNTLTLSGTDATTMTFPATSDTVVTLGATQTLTNKTLTTPTASALTLSDVATGTQCLHASSSGVVSGTGSDCANAAGRSIFTFACATVAQATTTKCFQGVIGNAATNGGLIPAGAFKHLYIAVNSAPASTQNYAFTILIGAFGSMSTSILTCTVAAATTTCNDTSDAPTATAGQQWSLQIVTSSTSGSTGAFSGSVEFDPT